MRITERTTASNALYNINEGRLKLDRLNEAASSSRVVNRPSDDPVSAKKILDLETQIKSSNQYVSNIKTGQTWLDMVGTSLEGMLNSVMSIKTAASEAAGVLNDPIKKADILSQLNAFRDQLTDYPNSQVGGQYVFSGFNSNTPPFDNITKTGIFKGTEDIISVEITKGVTVPISVSGGAVLRGSKGGVDIIGTLDALITSVTNDSTAGINAANVALDGANQQMLGVISDVGMRKARMDNALAAQQRNSNTLTEIHDNMQNVDYAKVALELTNQKTAFDAALAATAKSSSLSLLNYL
jgi:flagellar hook-associated protein 3 FlgL